MLLLYGNYYYFIDYMFFQKENMNEIAQNEEILNEKDMYNEEILNEYDM